MRAASLLLLTMLVLASRTHVAAQAVDRIRVTSEGARLRRALLAPAGDAPGDDGHPVRWDRVAIGAGLGAAVGALAGLWISSTEHGVDSGPGEILGLAIIGAVVGGFVGLATGK